MERLDGEFSPAVVGHIIDHSVPIDEFNDFWGPIIQDADEKQTPLRDYLSV